VNHNIRGTSKGTMNYTASDNWFRQNEGLYDDRFYTNNYEWCVMGDPYGFKMLCYYDPDQKFNEYVEVSPTRTHDYTGDPLVDCDITGGSGQDIFEMRLGNPNWKNYFWMHPIYTKELMDENDAGFSYVRVDGMASSHVLLDKGPTIRSIRSSNISNFTLMPLTAPEMEEYLYYAGFVSGLSMKKLNEDTKTFDIDGVGTGLTLKDIYKEVKKRRDAFTSKAEHDAYTPIITQEVADYIHDLLFSEDGQVEMKEGYYRIIPYNYERWDNLSGTEEGGRHYVRGYVYGNETTGYTNERTSTTSKSYDDRWEIETASNATTTLGDAGTTTTNQHKTLMLNEAVDRTEYDPASIFYFKSLTNSAGHTRYEVGTQGLWLSGKDGTAKMYVSEDEAYAAGSTSADHVRYEAAGSVISQLRLAYGNASEYDYLSYVQNYHEPENARRAALRKDFASFNFTRLYLQPVGDADDNLMALKVEVYPGKYTDENDGMSTYYFATLYVPYDVKIETTNAFAYVGKQINTFETEKLLECEKVPEKKVGSTTYEAGTFVPGGTPVLLRVPASYVETEESGSTTLDDYDRNDDTSRHFIRLSLPTSTPTNNSYITNTFFQGSYLEQVISHSDDIYVFGQATENYDDDAYKTLTKTEVGFYKNKNTADATTDYDKKDNYYVRHNKVFVLGSSLTTSPSRQFVGVTFEPSGIEEQSAEEGRRMPTGDVFDLQGRRVATEQQVQDGTWQRKATQGVYIRNGRKFVVK